MKNRIILLNGLIASGKNTVGKALVDKLIGDGYQAVFLDVDQEVFSVSPGWLVESDGLKSHHWQEARKNIAHKSVDLLRAGIIPIVAGPFFQEYEICGVTDYLNDSIEVHLFTLTAPLELRLERARVRNPEQKAQELIDQQKHAQEMGLDSINIIENTGEIEQTTGILLLAIERDLGRL